MEGRRDRIITPAEAELLLNALQAGDRALWAVAFYGGLRRGELMGLDWAAVDLERNLISVVRAWDPKSHEMVAPKSTAGTRVVPIASGLRGILLGHFLSSGRPASGLVFGREGFRCPLQR